MQEQFMSRECYFYGQENGLRQEYLPTRQGQAAWRVGKKVTGVSKRKFKRTFKRSGRCWMQGRPGPGLGKAIRMGLIQKPLKRDYKPADQAN